MIEILVSTAYLPPIEYFAKLIHFESCKIENFENYIKQTYRNRCNIITANGILNLSIPVTKTNGNHTLTRDIRISSSCNWQTNHWRAIESAYNKSSFFLYYRDELEKFYTQSFELLVDFNTELLKFLLKKTGITMDVEFTKDFLPENKTINDVRYSIQPKQIHSENIFPHYYQVFEAKHGFIPNVSIIDLLFNEGPESRYYLENIKFINIKS